MLLNYSTLLKIAVAVVAVHFILSRLYPSFSANLGHLRMLHPGMGPLV